MRGRAVAARKAHNLEVVGSNPTPATNFFDPMNFQTLLPADALSFIQTQGEQALVLDVRTPGEFEMGHLPMAVNMSVETIPQNMAQIPTDKTLVIYCEHGSRSKLAAGFLSARGYDKVYHIQGGFSALAPLL